MRKTKELLFILLFVIVLLLTAGTVCYAEVVEEEKELAVNQTLSVFVSKPYDSTISWECDNTNIVTIEEEGTGSAKIIGKNPGRAVVTATVNENVYKYVITVKYASIDVRKQSNDGDVRIPEKKMNLLLNKYDEVKLVSKVYDAKAETISSANVVWKSSDASIVTVDNTGKIKALKAGKATITATADTVSSSVEITVMPATDFTDFSNAKYELPFDTDTQLKISGINIKEDSEYYFVITDSNEDPLVEISKNGRINLDTNIKMLSQNLEGNFIFNSNIDQYAELNSDMYLWVYEQIKLSDNYIDDDENYVNYNTGIVVNGYKLTKPELPKLNEIIKSFNIGEWKYGDNEESNYTRIWFIFPSDTEDRKFTLKIGKVTDANILNKIHNNDYSGITALLTYAKGDNSPVYSGSFNTTYDNEYVDRENALFDGRSLLAHKAFYYIYAVFDDENGKYQPVEGVTLAQAWHSQSNQNWDMWAYTDSKIEWANLSSTPEEPVETPTNTTANKPIPYAGSEMIFGIICVIAILGITANVFYRKNNF